MPRPARILSVLLLICSVLALLCGPTVLLLFLGSTIGRLIGAALIIGGAVGLWMGMKSLSASNDTQASDLQ